MHTNIPVISQETENYSVVPEEDVTKEMHSEKWLYMALMTVLTVGYVHMMIFAALIFALAIYAVANCILSAEDAQRQVGHLSPLKLWLLIDQGIFILLDESDDDENFD